MNARVFQFRYWHKYLAWYLALGLIILGVVVKPQNAVESAKQALFLCGQVIVPSLLPFFVAASLLVTFGFARVIGNILNPIIRPLFGVSGKAGVAFVLGIISGYPVGAQVIVALYKNGDCDKEEAGRLLAFCNNSGPLFVIGAVGVSMFNSQYVGYILYLAHIISAIIVGILFGAVNRKKIQTTEYNYSPIAEIKRDIRAINKKQGGVGEAISEAVANSAQQMVAICGFVIFFAVIGRMLYDYGIFGNIASLFFRDGASQKLCANVLRAMVEMTVALRDIIGEGSIGPEVKIGIASFIIGFAGLSIHFQTMGVLSKTGIRINFYIIGKLLQGIIAAVVSVILLGIAPDIKPAFLQTDDKICDIAYGGFWDNISNSLIFLSVGVILIVAIMVIAYFLAHLIKTFKNNTNF